MRIAVFARDRPEPLNIGRSIHHDYYADATACERWECVYDGDNMLVELVGAVDS